MMKWQLKVTVLVVCVLYIKRLFLFLVSACLHRLPLRVLPLLTPNPVLLFECTGHCVT